MAYSYQLAIGHTSQDTIPLHQYQFSIDIADDFG